jgi:CheY-like chemotaxis protein
MQRPTLEGRSILIVEDEPLIALDIAQAFEPTGAKLTTTTTLQHGLILAQHDGLSAAILDHVLPDGDCSQLCELLKQRDIPFILYSGFGACVDACQDAPHLSKPAEPAVLVTLLQDLILGREAH